MMPYYLVDVCLCFRRTWCLHLQGLKSKPIKRICYATEQRVSNVEQNAVREWRNKMPSKSCAWKRVLASRYKVAAILLFVLGNRIKISRRIGCNLYFSLCFIIAQHWACAVKPIFGMASHVNQAKYCAVLSVFIREGGNRFYKSELITRFCILLEAPLFPSVFPRTKFAWSNPQDRNTENT